MVTVEKIKLAKSHPPYDFWNVSTAS